MLLQIYLAAVYNWQHALLAATPTMVHQAHCLLLESGRKWKEMWLLLLDTAQWRCV